MTGFFSINRSLIIFLAIVLLPAFVLGWLALRGVSEQQVIMERQTAELCQKETESLAAAARALIDDERKQFAETVRRLLATKTPEALASEFTEALSGAWERKAIGFAISPDGRLLCPTQASGRVRGDIQRFLRDNAEFLNNREVVEVYPVQLEMLNKPEAIVAKAKAADRAGYESEVRRRSGGFNNGYNVTQSNVLTGQNTSGDLQQRERSQIPREMAGLPNDSIQLRQPINQPAAIGRPVLAEATAGVASQITPAKPIPVADVDAAREAEQVAMPLNFTTSEHRKKFDDMGTTATRATPVPKIAVVQLHGNKAPHLLPTAEVAPLAATRKKDSEKSLGNSVPEKGVSTPQGSAHETRLAEEESRSQTAPGASAVHGAKADDAPAPASPPATQRMVRPITSAAQPVPAKNEDKERDTQQSALSSSASVQPDHFFVKGDPASTTATKARSTGSFGGAQGTVPPMPSLAPAMPMDQAKSESKSIEPPAAPAPAPALAGDLDAPTPSDAPSRALQKQATPMVLAPKAQSRSIPTTSDYALVAEPAQAAAPQEDELPQMRWESRPRNVLPQNNDKRQVAPSSELMTACSEFRDLVATGQQGMVTRFVRDRLDLILWITPENSPGLVFGCLIESTALADVWPKVLPALSSRAGAPDFIVGLLDHKARPVICLPAGSECNWQHPFVASEIGEALPHWEAAIYLAHPEQLRESARGWQRVLFFLIAAAVALIALGGWLVVADARRQVSLAQKKTDFVSNVSHELKTPLTSIRMFAEMLLSGRADTEKQPRYLRIIMLESERLSRLIDNVLDFAKLERQCKHFHMREVDLFLIIQSTWEAQEMHLQGQGFHTRWDTDPGPFLACADVDAIAQILVNLVSNAEKYSGENRDITLETRITEGSLVISVSDRGSGVPSGEEKKIFEPFYRAHDSLSGGIQGSGLGLTLAARLAREHQGEIRCDRRPGGGSIFTLRIPLLTAKASVA